MTRPLLILVTLLLAACTTQPEARMDDTHHLELGDEQIISVSTEEAPGWGFHQFPGIARHPDGRLIVGFHMDEDSSDSYGAGGYRVFVSADEGATWSESKDLDLSKFRRSARLPNGEYLSLRLDKPYPLEDLDLPAPVAHMTYSYDYTRNPTPFYRFSELPEQMQVLPLNRWQEGQWHDENPKIDLEDDIRPAYTEHFPMIFFGDVRLLSDGSLLAGFYPSYTTTNQKGAACFMKSTDDGKSWQLHGRIAYAPDTNADPQAVMRGGFTELSFVEADPMHLVCALRTTDASPGLSPLYIAHSTDGGTTWSTPKAVADHGVEPRLAKLDSGALILSYGRPGVSARVSFDGGHTWSAPREVVPQVYKDPRQDSCGYSALLPLDATRCLIAYSRFNYKGQRKAIAIRTLTSKKLSEQDLLFPQVSAPDEVGEQVKINFQGRKYQEFRLESGISRTYYPNGTLASETPFVKGKTHGIQRYYHPNGQLLKEISWKNDAPHGGIRTYNVAGICTKEAVRIQWQQATHEEWWDRDPHTEND